jgi:hypothetical protein
MTIWSAGQRAAMVRYGQRDRYLEVCFDLGIMTV